jgi:hypothetical protein
MWISSVPSLSFTAEENHPLCVPSTFVRYHFAASYEGCTPRCARSRPTYLGDAA